MSKDRKDPYQDAPPGLTDEKRREWWERQRRKWAWELGDIVITKEGDGKRLEGDDGDTRPGTPTARSSTRGRSASCKTPAGASTSHSYSPASSLAGEGRLG